MAKAKAKAKPRGASNPASPDTNQNLIWAVVGLLGVALLASGFTAYACEYVLKSFQDSNTMALLITDAGVKSDDIKLEHQLTSATLTLRFLRDIALATVVGGSGVALTIGLRSWLHRAK